MNALRHWFGSSIAGKLNAALTVIISIVFLVVGSLLTYWLGDSLEQRAVKELQLTNQQVVDMMGAYSSSLEESARLLGATFAASLPKRMSVDPAHPVASGEKTLPALKGGMSSSTTTLPRWMSFPASRGASRPSSCGTETTSSVSPRR